MHVIKKRIIAFSRLYCLLFRIKNSFIFFEESAPYSRFFRAFVIKDV